MNLPYNNFLHLKIYLFKILAIALLIINIAGCSATGPLYKEVAHQEAGKALLYIYRPSAFTAAMRTIYVNITPQQNESLKQTVELSNNEYWYAHISPGEYIFEQGFTYWVGDPSFLRDTKKVSFNIESGEVYYVAFYADYEENDAVKNQVSSSTHSIITPINSSLSITNNFNYGFGLVSRYGN